MTTPELLEKLETYEGAVEGEIGRLRLENERLRRWRPGPIELSPGARATLEDAAEVEQVRETLREVLAEWKSCGPGLDWWYTLDPVQGERMRRWRAVAGLEEGEQCLSRT